MATVINTRGTQGATVLLGTLTPGCEFIYNNDLYEVISGYPGVPVDQVAISRRTDGYSFPASNVLAVIPVVTVTQIV